MRRDNRRVLERVVQWMIAEDVRIVHVLVLTTFQTMAAILFFKLIFSFEVLYRDFFCTREFQRKMRRSGQSKFYNMPSTRQQNGRILCELSYYFLLLWTMVL